MLDIWDKIEKHVFTPYQKYLLTSQAELGREHTKLTKTPFMGWLHPSLVPRRVELESETRKLNWDIQLCRQAVSLVFTRSENERQALNRLPSRIIPKEVWAELKLSPTSNNYGPPEQQLSPEIIDRFDHYLGLKIVLSN